MHWPTHKPSIIPPWFHPPTPIQTSKPITAAVIGAGIAGCQISQRLAEQGCCVTLFEQNKNIASEASGNPIGIISHKISALPSLGERFYQQAFLRALQQLNDLQPEFNHQSRWWSSCGELLPCFNEREYKRWLQLKKTPSSPLLHCLNAEQVQSLPFDVGNRPACLLPQAAWVKPRSLCQTLLQHANIKLITNTCIDQCKYLKDRQIWQLSDSNHAQMHHADIVILACAHSTARLVDLQSALPFTSIAGQTSFAHSTLELPHILAHQGYITPRIQGKHIFGATFEVLPSHIKPFQLDTNPNADQQNLSQLKQHCPQIANRLKKIHSAHAAARMATPDRFPYVGALPDIHFYRQQYHDITHGRHWIKYPKAQYQSSLYALLGLGSRGLTSSALCADHLASQILGTPSPLETDIAQALHPARFFIKHLKRHPDLSQA